MMKVRKARDRGFVDLGWLKSYHTFSFGSYFDREHIHFRNLRVINHDFVAAGTGFDTHPHKNMEIITYVVEGAVSHHDTMGNETVIPQGEIQRMSAGTGIAHSERNNSHETLEILQIWIIPNVDSITPSYQQALYDRTTDADQPVLLVSPDGRNGSLKIFADAEIYRWAWQQPKKITLSIPASRHVWVQMVRGSLQVNHERLGLGDGLAISVLRSCELRGISAGECLIFVLP